jgi:hypothetical protein
MLHLIPPQRPFWGCVLELTRPQLLTAAAEAPFFNMAEATKSSPPVVGLALVRHSRCISCHTLEVALASKAALQGPDTGGGGSQARSKEWPKF